MARRPEPCSPGTVAAALLAALIVGVLAGGPAGAAEEPHEALYVRGLEAVDFKRWREAVVFFDAAIEARGESGGLVWPYGTWVEPYVPYYYLGLALYELGHYGRAMRMWRRAEEQGPILYPRSRPKLRRMERLRSELPQRVSRELEALRRVWEELAAAAARQGEGRLPVMRGPETEGGSFAEKMARLGALSARLAAGERLTPEELDELERLRDRAAESLAATADLLARQRLERERERRLEREAAERRLERESYAEAAALLAAGGCVPAAIETLRVVVERGLSEPLEGEPARTPHLLLAEAHLACGEPYRALLELALARRLRRADPGRLAVAEQAAGRALRRLEGAPSFPVSEGPEPRWLAARALAAYLEADAWSRLDGCRREPLERLDEARRGYDPELARALSSGLSYQPELVVARAHRSCGRVREVAAALARARRAAGVDPRELAELTAWLERADEEGFYTASHALLIVAHDYLSEGWSDLSGALSDLEPMRRSLESHGFEVELLENPTSAELVPRVQRFFARHGGDAGHRLLVYYAGHGWTRPRHGVTAGFLVPVDTPHPDLEEREALEKMVSMDAFNPASEIAAAHHALFVFDACFGGSVFRQTRSWVSPEVVSSPPEVLLERPVRMYLSAGDEDERVPDFSFFRRALQRGLEGAADANGDALVLGHELAGFVCDEVRAGSITTPRWGMMAEGRLGDGDLVFRSLGGGERGPAARLRAEVEAFRAALDAADPPLLRGYLELYPEGRFAELAAGLLAR